MNEKTKKILIIAAVCLGAYLLFFRRTAQTTANNVPSYLDNINYEGRESTNTGNFYADIIGAATNAGEKFTRDIRSFIEQARENNRKDIQQQYDYDAWLRLNSSMYNSGF